jgi:hypothetical protein
LRCYLQDGSEFDRAVATFEAVSTNPRHAAAAAAVATAYRPLMPLILEAVTESVVASGSAAASTSPRCAALLIAAADVGYVLPTVRQQVARLADLLSELQHLLRHQETVDSLSHALLLLLCHDTHVARRWGSAALLRLLLHTRPAVRWAAVRACSLCLGLSGGQASKVERQVLSEEQSDACWQAWETHLLRLEVRVACSCHQSRGTASKGFTVVQAHLVYILWIHAELHA